MKKNIMYLGFFILIAGLIFLSIGCGSSTSSDTATTTTLPAAAATGSVSITGTLNTGTIASSVAISSTGVKAQATAYAAEPDYNVVAISKNSGEIYFADAATDSSGSFTISNLPSGESYYLEILDSNNKLAAPVAFGASAGKAIMAVTPEASAAIELGAIVYDDSQDSAAPTTAPTSYFDNSTSVEVQAGTTLVPKGAGNFGKGSETEISSGYDDNKVDGDNDGLPNIVDADNNGDLIVDELDGLYTMEAISAKSTMNFYPYAFTNLKVDYNNRTSFKTNYQEFDIAVGVTPGNKGSASAKTISSAKVIAGPAWIDTAIVAGTNTAADGSLWGTTDHSLVNRSGSDAYEVHLSSLKPLTDVNAGDALKFKVIYTDGTSEESMKMINFVFTDIPQVTGIKYGSGAWQTSGLTFPTRATSNEITVRWTRPLDESTREVIGGRYTFEYNSSGGGAIETVIITRDADSTLTSLEGSCNLLTLPSAAIPTYGDASINMLIGVCIRSDNNDNAAENIWFSRGDTW
ncbi:hypothetical protein COT42_04485 [Candidatus Saganbacteria bacterium CG08_land_8_20_14_0_20_45_16]|uniref:Uncharacterized protein n=1 Tax=Candidatus Saganbacteria bacterium CG08_land_8_20_14_0_20_45_16 TaxID=2014293 RepID=A0A2H0XXQ3_UNCSA|nr:MAG: hypothetical protein COT42_04485 [Candidatus Saganbacteria bacterium CG08_land_8_20_14_0_20_45_16]